MSKVPGWLSRLLEEPGAYDPFVAIGLLEQHTADAKRIGGDGPYDEEGLRFRHARSLAFKPGDLEAVEVRPGARKERLAPAGIPAQPPIRRLSRCLAGPTHPPAGPARRRPRRAPRRAP